MKKFNVGDRVKVTHIDPPSTVKAITDRIGQEGIVTKISDGKLIEDNSLYVLFDDESTWYFFEDELELVK